MGGRPNNKIDSGPRFCTECSTKRQEDELTCGACGYAFESLLTPDTTTINIPTGKGSAARVSQTAIMNKKPSISDSGSFRAEEQTQAPQMSSKRQKKYQGKTNEPKTESNLGRVFYLFLIIALFIYLYYV